MKSKLISPSARATTTSLIILLTLLTVLVSCQQANSTGNLEEVTFMAGFKPQANLPFVGVYVAQEKGFFEEEGLQVDIKHVPNVGDNFRLLAGGNIDFTTSDSATIIQRRADDPSLPITAIALIGQEGQQGFISLRASGINSPSDWKGKTIGYKGSSPSPEHFAMLKKAGLSSSDVEFIRVGFDPRVITTGEVDIYPVFISNEPDTLEKLGYELNLFAPADYGIASLGLTYATSDSYISSHSETVTRFLRAALRGVRYAEQNKNEALDITMGFAPLEDRDHMEFMLSTEIASAQSDTVEDFGIGWMTDQQWHDQHDLLVEYEAIDLPLKDIGSAYNRIFLTEIYKN